MEFYDMHVHTAFSFDGTTSIDGMAQAAIQQGLRGIAITDHFNPDFPETRYRTELPSEQYFLEMERIREKYAGQFGVLRGLEIGAIPGKTVEKCQMAAAHDYDFLLLGIHCDAIASFSTLARSGELRLSDLYERVYGTIARCILEFNDFDALAHINSIDRYAQVVEDGLSAPYIEAILKLLVQKGKALEINTSSYRFGMKERTTPTLAILRRFFELGGEMVTIGSDAHRPEDIGTHMADACDMLRACNWRYYTIFVDRKPVYISL